MTGRGFDATAAAYEGFLGRWSRLWATALVAATRLTPGARVLEVAAGSGQATHAAATAAGPSGRVIATDLSVEMLRVAHAAPPAAPSAPVAFAAMDGRSLAVRDETVDAVVCLLGLMFFPDPLAGLAEFRRVLRPGGRAALAVWAEPERAPFPGIMVEVLARHLPFVKRELEVAFALADEAQLETLLRDSGFEDVAVGRESRAVKFESFDDFWEPIEAGSRAGAALRDLPEPARLALQDDLRARMAAYETQGWLVMDCETLLATGRR